MLGSKHFRCPVLLEISVSFRALRLLGAVTSVAVQKTLKDCVRWGIKKANEYGRFYMGIIRFFQIISLEVSDWIVRFSFLHSAHGVPIFLCLHRQVVLRAWLFAVQILTFHIIICHLCRQVLGCNSQCRQKIC